jgi:hypothetical protein
MSDKLAEEQIRVYTERKAERDSKFSTTWQTLSQYFLPSQSDVNVEKTEGTTGWTDQIFDTTANMANRTMAAGQRNWLTPSTEPWAEFQTPVSLTDDNGEAADWLAKASDTAMSELARSNFYSIVNMAYLGVGCFGTDVILVEDGKKTALNFRHFKINTYTIAEDDEGVVDSVHREFELSGRQIKQMFQMDELSPDLQRKLKTSKGLEEKTKFLHAIFPRKDSERLDKRADGANKPVASVYIEIATKHTVRESGYDEMPALCQRFSKWGTDSPWGFAPAYDALPEARQLNYVVQYTDALAELHAYPRIMRPSSLVGDVDLRAGGVTTFDPMAGEMGIPKEWATVGDLASAENLKQEKRTAINSFFYVDVFKRLNSNPLLDKQMTAYEISRREAEDLNQFTPAFDRRITEFLNPLMKRVFGILFRAGKFGTPPPSLMKPIGLGKAALRMPEVVITSRIALALKALQNRGTEATFAFVAPFGEQHPEVYDVFDIDATIKTFAYNAGMKPSLMRSSRDLGKLRAQRQQQIAQQQAMQMGQQAAQGAAALGKAPQFVQQAAQGALGGGQ